MNPQGLLRHRRKLKRTQRVDVAEGHAFIGVGSNVGDRLMFCQEAVRRLSRDPSISVLQVSSLYETAPMEYLHQDDFYNAVIELKTDLTPEALLERCQEIERQLGKKVTILKGPRTIDLDLLFYDQEVVVGTDLVLPHPAAARRPFVLIPLAEIAPDLVHPVLHQKVADLSATAATAATVMPTARIHRKFPKGWETVHG